MAGNKYAQITQAILLNKQGYKPPHVIQAVWRGTQWLIDFHFPSGHGSTQAFYTFMQPTILTDWGLAPKDLAGNLSVSSVAWVSPTTILLTVGRTTSAAANPTLWVSDATLHNGFCNIADADPYFFDDTYYYSQGNGQALTENFSSIPTVNNPIANGYNLPAYCFCIPAVVPVVAG